MEIRNPSSSKSNCVSSSNFVSTIPSQIEWSWSRSIRIHLSDYLYEKVILKIMQSTKKELHAEKKDKVFSWSNFFPFPSALVKKNPITIPQLYKKRSDSSIKMKQTRLFHFTQQHFSYTTQKATFLFISHLFLRLFLLCFIHQKHVSADAIKPCPE